jgi:hypothetical protein
MIGSLAFARAEREAGRFNPPWYAGTSGGAWGAYAACREAKIERLENLVRTGELGGMSFMDQLKSAWKGGGHTMAGHVVAGALKASPTLIGKVGGEYLSHKVKQSAAPLPHSEFRRLWGKNMWTMFAQLDAAVPTPNSPNEITVAAHVACRNKIMVTEARQPAGEVECGRGLKHCRNLRRKLTCHGETTQLSESFRDAMITSSAAATTDLATAESFGVVDVAKHKGPPGGPAGFEYYDIGACDNNPWTELVRRCDKIVNIDFSTPGTDTLKPSRGYLASRKYKLLHTELKYSNGEQWGDTIVAKKGDRVVKVVNLNMIYDVKGKKSRTFPSSEFLPTSIQTFTPVRVAKFYDHMKKFFVSKDVRNVLQFEF